MEGCTQVAQAAQAYGDFSTATCLHWSCLCCLQKTYHTPEEHKAGMRKHMKGWNSPHMEKLIAATEPSTILLSHIYQR